MNLRVPPEQPHILIVDDDRDIRTALASYFERYGFRTSVAADGKAMDRILAASAIDLIVLDVMLPGEDGLVLCRRLQETTRAPIILLTALTETADRIVGLEMGADDYVSKPFDPRELLARVRSILRRAHMLPQRQRSARGTVRFERWHFDMAHKEVVSEGLTVRLSTGEHRLLVTFLEHAGLTLTRDQLIDLTRGRQAQLFDRSIDNQVSRLRRKLEIDPKHPRIILTQWGGGYVFAAELQWL